MEFKTLSIKNPWAYHIFFGNKYVENRVWQLPDSLINKTVLIHVSMSLDNLAHQKHLEYLADDQGDWVSPQELIRSYKDTIELQSGKIVGALKFIKCTTNYNSEWAETSDPSNPVYNWVIDNWSVQRFDEKDYISTKGQ